MVQGKEGGGVRSLFRFARREEEGTKKESAFLQWRGEKGGEGAPLFFSSANKEKREKETLGRTFGWRKKEREKKGVRLIPSHDIAHGGEEKKRDQGNTC